MLEPGFASKPEGELTKIEAKDAKVESVSINRLEEERFVVCEKIALCVFFEYQAAGRLEVTEVNLIDVML